MQGCILTTVFALLYCPVFTGDDKEQIKLTRIANLDSRIIDCHYSSSLKSYLVATAKRVHVVSDGSASKPSVLHQLPEIASACWIDESNGLVMLGISLQEFGKSTKHKLLLISPDGGLRELEIPGAAEACVGGGVIATAGAVATIACVFKAIRVRTLFVTRSS